VTSVYKKDNAIISSNLCFGHISRLRADMETMVQDSEPPRRYLSNGALRSKAAYAISKICVQYELV
jgi:hypothetical protein